MFGPLHRWASDYLWGPHWMVGLLWLGLIGLSFALLVLMRTRWGQSRPLRKCFILSLIAHLLLAGYATTIQIVIATPGGVLQSVTEVAIVEEFPEEPFQAVRDDAQESRNELAPWDRFADGAAVVPPRLDAPPASALEPRHVVDLPQEPSLPRPIEPRPTPEAAESPADLQVPDSAAEMVIDPVFTTIPHAAPVQPIEAPKAQRHSPEPPPLRITPQLPPMAAPGVAFRVDEPPVGLVGITGANPLRADLPDAALLSAQLDALLTEMTDAAISPQRRPAGATPAPPAAAGGEAAEPAASDHRAAPAQRELISAADALPAAAAGARRLLEQNPEGAESEHQILASLHPVLPPRLEASPAGSRIPEIYRLRVATDRRQQALLRGATAATENAVELALAWLARNQEANGRWEPSHHQAGVERRVAGRDRFGAGAQADTGMTGLALLAFLGAGHTHVDGQYRATVQRGLQYLLASQRSDGSLGGEAELYAYMYCHAMAALALSEAYALTSEQQLRLAIERAVAFTVATQDPAGGGWRYRPRDPGDTSQLGWQLMALHSARLAGISVPDVSLTRAKQYLQTVSSGQYGGLAGYRPGELSSPAMTAEAWACRLFLGELPNAPASREAGEYLIRRPPGEGEANFYYWYYGTLAMYLSQCPHWAQWNRSLTQALLARQRKSSPHLGSWDPSTTWGGYGGRVYTTALATLCLEVYYRYLPFYQTVP